MLSLYFAIALAQGSFDVHEWGTFTTVVTEDGHEIQWNSIVLDDLPTFVHDNQVRYKYSITGRVRMETPVLYFYTKEPITVDVEVGFPEGILTEWYPRARYVDKDLKWKGLLVDPHSSLSPPVEVGGDHYYAARGVGAAPVSMRDEEGNSESEKFLFYRGVGDFLAPMGARVVNSKIIVHNRTPHPIRSAMLFVRNGNQVGMAIRHEVKSSDGEIQFDPDELIYSSPGRLDDLKRILKEEGLFEDEAQAMIDTWRHDWFEEGTRVFYTLPIAFTEEILPLKITPEPKSLVRVMIGRIEVMPKEADKGVTEMLESHSSKGDAVFDEMMAQYGRFSIALAQDQLQRRRPDPTTSTSLMEWRFTQFR